MKLVNFENPVTSEWLHKQGSRLDANPFLSGAVEAKITLEELSARKDSLEEVTESIYHAGRESRTWVEDPDYGVPFMGSTDILAADLSSLPYISKKQVARNPRFRVREGWTLITRSGTIGRTAYVRPDMDGLACSEHVLRVVPKKDKILPGYLYAYLSSRYGVSIITSGTYGAIIQHIEPEHIADLPVPRLGEEVERQVHELVQEAADLRTKASATLKREARKFTDFVDKVSIGHESPRISFISSRTIQKRFDAAYHDPVVKQIKEAISARLNTTIGEFCSRVFLPGIFKRLYTVSLQHGAYYYTGASLFTLEPKPKGILSRKTSKFDEVFIEAGTILVQAFGQDGGLTGRPVWVGDHLHNSTTTHMLVRLNVHQPELAGYLYAFLLSDIGYRQVASLTYGGSIPHLDESGMASVVIPLLSNEEMEAISLSTLQALSDRDKALFLELKARKLIENAIEGIA